MVFTKATATVKSLCHPKGSKFKKIKLDCVWQRSFVWDTERSSMFIHTLMTNGFVYPILVAEDEKDASTLLLLDGLQRTVVCRKFISGETKLDPNTPAVGEYDVARKTFKQLPTELQDAILDYSFDLVYVKGATEEDLGNLFHKVNMSAPITKTTLLRAEAGVEIANYLDQFEKMDFFSKRAIVSPSARKTHGLTEMVLQSLALFTMQNISFSSKDLKKFALGMKTTPITAEVTEAFRQTIQYLEKAFPDVEGEAGEEALDYDFLKKSALPLIVKSGEVCLENSVDPLDYFDWITKFFSGKDRFGVSFKSNSASGTGAKNNIKKRMGYMLESLKANFPDLEIPSSCDFAVWDRMEAELKIELDRIKAEKAILKAERMKATMAKRAEKKAEAEAKASAPSKAPEFLTATASPEVFPTQEESEAIEDEIFDFSLVTEDEEEEEEYDTSLFEAIRKATTPAPKTSDEEVERVMREVGLVF